MESAIRETLRRREIQQKYNEAHGITPKTIVKKVTEVLEISTKEESEKKKKKKCLTASERKQEIEKLTKEMKAAAPCWNLSMRHICATGLSIWRKAADAGFLPS